MKKLVLILAVLFPLSIVKSFGQLTHVLLKEDTCRLRINGLSILDLNMAGVNFETLAVFGQLQDSAYARTFVEETWELYYPGLSLTFIDRHGHPNVFELEISSFDDLEVEFCQKRINSHSTELFDFEGNSKEKIQIETINENTTEAEKNGNGYSYLEMILNSNKQIKSIRYKDQGH